VNRKTIRIILFFTSAIGLCVIFLLQHFSYAYYILRLIGVAYEHASPTLIYSINKSIRFVLNDAMALLMIYSLFEEKKYVIVGFVVQLFGMLILLPAYLILHNYFFYETRIWLSFLHRLTLNPVLLMLLIPAFFYQKKFYAKKH